MVCSHLVLCCLSHKLNVKRAKIQQKEAFGSRGSFQRPGVVTCFSWVKKGEFVFVLLLVFLRFVTLLDPLQRQLLLSHQLVSLRGAEFLPLVARSCWTLRPTPPLLFELRLLLRLLHLLPDDSPLRGKKKSLAWDCLD